MNIKRITNGRNGPACAKICEDNDDFCHIHVVLKFEIAHYLCNNTPNN